MMIGALTLLELSKRNDGCLISAGDPALGALLRAGLVATTAACDGYVIVRAIPETAKPRPITVGYRGSRLAHDDRGRWRASDAGASA